jgi:L-rhamnose-H+ transport protein
MEWILLSVFAGMCNGSFALPMKFTTKWKWENIWSAFALWGFVIFPVLLGVITIPNLFDIFQETGTSVLLFVFMFGFMWGVGSICFGLGIRYIGIGLAFSINIGMTIAIGSLLPLFLKTINTSFEAKSVMAVITGVIIIIIGVVINGYSAFLRGKEVTEDKKDILTLTPLRKDALIGIVLCIVAGIMSPMLQIAFIYGGEIVQIAKSMGGNETMASNAIWIIALFGGFVSNLLYTVWLLTKNNSWRFYKIEEAKKYHLNAIIMGLLWVVTIACYGMAVSNMGELGLSVGWAIFNSVGIIWANFLGLLTKEWKNVPKKTIFVMIVGLIVLVLGTGIVSMAK